MAEEELTEYDISLYNLLETLCDTQLEIIKALNGMLILQEEILDRLKNGEPEEAQA